MISSLIIQVNYWQLIGPELNFTLVQLSNSVSVNLVGLAMGCVFFIPLTRKYGRRPTYMISTAILAAMSFWTARMNSLVELYITNLIYGLAGATNETVVMMTVSSSAYQSNQKSYKWDQVSDLFFVHQRGKMNGLYLTTVVFGVRFFL